MRIILLSVAMLAVAMLPLASQASAGPIVYGKLHVSVDHLDYDDAARGDYWQVKSRGSRLGVKGSEDLGAGLKAIYMMEFQIDVADSSDANNVKSRNQYVGLQGGWGTFLVGRHNTAYKVMTNKDLFDDTVADWDDIGFVGGAGAIVEDKRVNNAIMYLSPDFNGLALAATVSPGETNTDDGINDYYTSVAGKYSNGPLYVGLAYEQTEFQGDDGANPTSDDQDKWRVYARYKIGDFSLGGMYQDVESDENLEDVDATAWQVNGTYSFGNNVLKLAYQDGEVDDDRIASAAYDSPEYDAWMVGLDHNLSKRTRAYLVYLQVDTNDDAQDADSLGNGTEDWDAFSLGLVHKF